MKSYTWISFLEGFIAGLLSFIILLFATSCGSVPPALVSAHKAEAQVTELLDAEEATIIAQYDREVRRMANAIIDRDRIAELLRATDANGNIPLSKVDEVEAKVKLRRDSDIKAWEDKRDELLKSPNKDLRRRLHAMVGEYLEAMDDTARQIEAIIGEIQGAKK